MLIQFIKMHGRGNDFVVIDNRQAKFQLDGLDFRRLSDRRFGIGCDQLVILEPSERASARMRIVNADGSEVEACGNASRCVAWLLYAEQEDSGAVSIETQAGVITARVQDEHHITVDMGLAGLEWQAIPLAKAVDTLHLPVTEGPLSDPVGVSMGNPHMVFFVDEPYAINLEQLGPALECHPLFPEHANVSVARVESEEHITLRVWERGSGATLACGTAACATLVAAHRRGLTGRRASVDLPGGMLHIEWRESDGHVLMTGPVATSFVGTFLSEMYSI